MAISLLPVKKSKKEFKINRELIKENKSVVFVCIVLLAVLIVYFSISIYASSLEDRTGRLLQDAENIQSQRDIAKEEDVISLNTKLSTAEDLLNNQIITSKLFAFIESITHPMVYFTNFTFRANDKTVIANGSTENYTTFGEQYIALQQNKNISDIRVSSVKLAKTGKVEFGISFAVDERVYKP